MHETDAMSTEHLDALLRATRAVIDRPAEEAVSLVFAACKGLVGARGGFVALCEHEHAESVVLLDAAEGAGGVDLGHLVPIAGLRRAAYDRGAPVWDNERGGRPAAELLPGTPLRAERALIVPMAVGGDVVGTLGLADRPGGFDATHGEQARGFAELAALALQGQRARVALRRSEERLRNIFNSVVDGILVAEVSTGRFLLANRAMCELLGYSREELLELSVPDIHPAAELPGVTAQFARQARGEGRLAADTPTVRKDGTVFFADINAVPFVLDGREVLMGSFRDTTGRRALQAALAEANRRASVGTLAAGVGHEINNPLAYVIDHLERLAAELPALGRGDLAARSAEALAGARRIKTIVRGLTTFSRAKGEVDAPVDLSYVADCAVTLARHELAQRARVVRELDPVPPVRGSEAALCQLFLNLLVNASQEIPAGSPECHEIRVRTWAEGAEVCAEVADSGRGIPAEHLERAFEPYAAARSAGSAPGLGLSICRNIVNATGGTIALASEVGKGTRVTVRLPALPPTAAAPQPAPPRAVVPPAPAPAPPPAPAPQRARGRVLVIDDEPPIRAMIARMLRGQHEVVTAESGAEGRRILAADRAFDAIVSDLMMPDVSGIDLHAWLAAEDHALAERMVFVTGGACTPRARDYLALVDNPCLEKPFDAPALRAALAALVDAGRRAG